MKDPVAFGKYDPKQIETGIKLTTYLVDKYSIKPRDFFAHSTVAIDHKGAWLGYLYQKSDPGINFLWKEFSKNGIGLQITDEDKFSVKESSGQESNQDESSLIWTIQEKLNAIGFVGCPEENSRPRSLISSVENLGQWNQLTQEAAKAFALQYATELYNSNPDFINKERLFQYLCVYMNKYPEIINIENPFVNSKLSLTAAVSVVVAGTAAIGMSALHGDKCTII